MFNVLLISFYYFIIYNFLFSQFCWLFCFLNYILEKNRFKYNRKLWYIWKKTPWSHHKSLCHYYHIAKFISWKWSFICWFSSPWIELIDCLVCKNSASQCLFGPINSPDLINPMTNDSTYQNSCQLIFLWISLNQLIISAQFVHLNVLRAICKVTS